ncbi:CBF/Mak21 family-domain-containing protein [Lipomyces oligophaga]|uniref:CBF/Mak21 family-domain-containing protein n=1 Tax=Lipomyces oligophaga TaxID=45792 RepID=UPI0034CED8B1
MSGTKARHNPARERNGKFGKQSKQRSQRQNTELSIDKDEKPAKRRQHKTFDGEGKEHVKLHEPGLSTKNLLIPVQSDWHAPDLLDQLLPSSTAADSADAVLDDDQKSQLLEESIQLLEQETEAYTTFASTSSSQRQFFQEIVKAGTLSDRISALTLVIQESPLHGMRSLNGLMGLAKKKNRTAALQAVEALKDLFGAGNVLPDRKLVWFTNRDPAALSLLFSVICRGNSGNQPYKIANLAKQYAVLWAFEDWLKQFFFSFVQLLESLSHDQVEHVRQSVLNDIIDLLRDKPEQEMNLLRLAVNKLGDADRKVSSKASHLLLLLEQAHPAMKRVIVNGMTELIFRPGADYHARYYGMVTLNQTIVTGKESDLANILMEAYFNLFERLMAENRLAKEDKAVEKKVKKKGRWKDKEKGKQNGNQTNQKAVKISPEAQEEANMKLLSAILTGLNRAFPYSSLEDEVFKKHLAVIYDVARSGNFNTRVQALMFLYQISNSNEVQSNRFYRTLYESLLDPRVIISSKQALYLNLVFKAIKSDINPDRVKAFAKRLAQVALETLNVGFCAGVVYLLNELETTSPFLRTLLTEPPDTADDAEEVFRDVPDDSDDEEERKAIQPAKPSIQVPEYNGKIHDPIRSNASFSCLWEITLLVRHFHPTIAHFAENYMQGDPPGERPDLALHTLMHFLDRFVYKSPKSKPSKALTGGAGSIMQPLASNGAYVSRNILVLSTKTARRSLPSMNSIDWSSVVTRKKEEMKAMPADEQFFANYFISKGVKPKAVSTVDDDTELDSDGDYAAEVDNENDGDMDEDEVWKAMMDSQPDLDEMIGEDSEDEEIENEEFDYEEEADNDQNEQKFEERDDQGSDEAIDFEEASDDDDLEDDSDDDRALAAALAASDSDLEDDEDDEDISDGDDLDDLFDRESEALKQDSVPSKGAKRGLIDDDEENIGGQDNSSTKLKRNKQSKKRKLKDLPIFASAEDYQALIDAE